MRGRSVATLMSVALALGMVLVTAGCSTGVACPAIGAAHGLYLDSWPWLSAHPTAQLRACFDGLCRNIDAATPEPVMLDALGAHSGGELTLTVESSGAAAAVLISRSIQLSPKVIATGPCPLTAWGQNARLGADGTLTVNGWNGQASSPAETSPSLAPTVAGRGAQ